MLAWGQLMNTGLGPCHDIGEHLPGVKELEPWFHHNLLPFCSSFSRARVSPASLPSHLSNTRGLKIQSDLNSISRSKTLHTYQAQNNGVSSHTLVLMELC